MADTNTQVDSNGDGPFMLTTTDNPYDPFTQWSEWFAFDVSHGHHTCSLLARLTLTSNDLSFQDEDLALQQAIDEVAKENVSGMHRKVSRKS